MPAKSGAASRPGDDGLKGDRGIRFCVHLGARGLRDEPVERLLEQARVADGAGVDSLWVPEDPFHWDAFAILGSVAGVTERVRLGTGVTSPYVRPPHLQAMSVATLDRLSGGRAFLGLGRSLPRWYEVLLGMEVGDPVEVVEQTVGLLRQWWSAPHTASSKGHFRVRGLKRYTTGVQAHLPVYVAAVGPRMLRAAARVADGVIFHWPGIEFLRRTIGRMTSWVAEAGRDPGRFAFIVSTGLEVTGEPETALAGFKREMAVYLSVPGMERSLGGAAYDVPGIVAEVRRAMRSREVIDMGGWTEEFHRLSDFDAAARAIPVDLVDEVAIAGDTDAVRRRLGEYQSLGVTHVFVPAPEGMGREEYAGLLESIRPAP